MDYPVISCSNCCRHGRLPETKTCSLKRQYYEAVAAIATVIESCRIQEDVGLSRLIMFEQKLEVPRGTRLGLFTLAVAPATTFRKPLLTLGAMYT